MSAPQSPPPRRRFRAAMTIAPRYTASKTLGMPKACMVITNSERKTMACGRKWFLTYGLGLKQRPGMALRFGRAWDDVQGLIMEWYKEMKCALTLDGLFVCEACGMEDPECHVCDGTGAGPLQRVLSQMDAAEDAKAAIHGADPEYPDLRERVERVADGWIRTYGESFARDFDVLATQVEIAVPITSPKTGGIYKSKVPVVAVEDGWEMASAETDPGDVTHVTMPWYQLVKLDAVVRRRSNGMLHTWETKSSASPESFSRDVLLDTQLPGYERGLRYATAVLDAFQGSGVDGWIWDVSCSKMQSDPKRLEDGSLSTDGRQRVPSWRWAGALDDEGISGSPEDEDRAVAKLVERISEQGLAIEDGTAEVERLVQAAKEAPRGKDGAPARAARDEAKVNLRGLKEQLRGLKKEVKAHERLANLLRKPQEAAEGLDPQLYKRVWGHFTDDDLFAYEVELFGDAQRIAAWIRNLPGTSAAPVTMNVDVALHWPRVPICRQPGGYCPMTSICLNDSDEARLNFDAGERPRWLHAAAVRRLSTTPETTDTPENP